MGKRAKETQNTNKANCDREEYARMIQEKNKIGQPRINQLAEKKSPQTNALRHEDTNDKTAFNFTDFRPTRI